MKSFFQKAADVISGEIGLSSVNIQGTHVNIGQKLAEGGYGCVYRAKDNYGKSYAVKVMCAPDSQHYQETLNEFETQKKCCQHPNVVKVYGISSDNSSNQATILMELCSGECVKEMNDNFRSGFDTNKIVTIFSQVCEAVNFMHELDPPIQHRDLKVENILYNDGRYKLCDFGSATTRVYNLDTNEDRNIASDDIQKNTTAMYRAPEMCDLYRRQKITTKADVWALGAVLFKLCTFKDAFPDGSNLQILNCRYSWPSDRNVDERLKKIVKYCLTVDADKRPTARDVLGALQKEFPDIIDPKWKSTVKVQTPQKETQQSPQPQKSQSQEFSPFGSNSPFASQSSPFASQSSPFANQQSPFASQSSPFGSNSPFASQSSQFGSQSSPFASNGTPFANQQSPFASQNVQSGGPSLISFEAEPVTVVSHNVITSADPDRMTTDRQNLINELLKMPENEVAGKMFELNTASPEKAQIFFFAFLHAAGYRAPKLIQSIPALHDKCLQELMSAHKAFSSKFPQFEGNFALGVFMQKNRANPPPVGQPPISLEAVKELLHIIQLSVSAIRAFKENDIAEEAFFAYQTTAYMLAKLKQFKINEGYVDGTSIPQFTGQHSLLKRAFDAFPEKIPFPPQPFDFNSPEFLKKIRPPTSRSLPK